MNMDATMKGFPLFEEKFKSTLVENCAILLDDSQHLLDSENN